jgi:precorrin-8X/cobalt-precorrin-8 methylmutase
VGELARDVAFTPDLGPAARAALRRGAPILCDAQMVASGITRRRLPAD